MADRYRVAIVVATEVEAVDDAGELSDTDRRINLHFARGSNKWTVAVHSVRPLDMALRNGHVRLEVAPPRHTAEEEDPNV